MFDGIEVGDAHDVGHETSRRRTAPRPHGNAPVFGVVDEIGDDEKIGRETHLLDDADFIVEARVVLFELLVGKIGPLAPDELQPFGEPLPSRFIELVLHVLTGLQRKDGKVVFSQIHLEIALFGDGDRIGQRFGNVGEFPRHVFRGFEIEVVRGELHALFVEDGLPRLDAEQDFMSASIAPAQVVTVVGRHQREPQLAAQTNEPLVHDRLLRHSVGLDFEIVIAGRKNLRVFHRRISRRLFLFSQEVGRHFPLEAGRQPDEPVPVLPQNFLVDARLVVKPVDVGLAHELQEVLVAGEIL